MGWSVEVDKLGVAAAVVIALLWYLAYRYNLLSVKPSIQVYTLKGFEGRARSWRAIFGELPRYLFVFALCCFLAALIHPRIYFDIQKEGGQSNPSTVDPYPEGLAIYLVLDQSGSMAEKVDATIDGRFERISKIDLLKKLTRSFVEKRPSDLIGVVFFARSAQIEVPLTLDHRAVLDALNRFNTIQVKDMDGTGIGYALYKTVNLIDATRHYASLEEGGLKGSYDIKNSIIILVTDGLQDQNPLDEGKRWRELEPDEAAQFAKKDGIKIYIVNVDPEINKPEYQPNRNQMRRTAEITGGKFFTVENAGQLQQIYQQIDQLEKSKLPVSESLLEAVKATISKDQLPQYYRTLNLYPYLIALGMAAVFIAIVLKTTLLRTLP